MASYIPNFISNVFTSGKEKSNENKCDSTSVVDDDDLGGSDLESVPTQLHFQRHTWKNEKNDSYQNKKFSADKKEYIKKKWEDGNFTYSGKLSLSKYIDIKIHATGSLLTYKDNFVALFTIKNYEELNFSKSFKEVKEKLFKKLVITEILKDDLLNKRDEAYSNFKNFLLSRIDKTADNHECAEDFLQLSKILDNHYGQSKVDSIIILKYITETRYNSDSFRNLATKLLTEEENFRDRRNKMCSWFGDSAQPIIKDLFGELQNIYKECIKNHKKALTSNCPRSIIARLRKVTERQLIFVSNRDMKLLSDLSYMMNEEPFLEFVDDLQVNLFRNIEQMRKCNSLKDFAPLTHPIYLFLFKSFQELIVEIRCNTNFGAQDLLFKNDCGQWILKENLNLSHTLLNYSLEQQYCFIFKLMNHFKPGNYKEKNKFDYNFEVLKNTDDKRTNFSIKSTTMSEEYLVWMYILDKAVANVLKETKTLERFKPLLEGYINFIRNAKEDSFESLRVITHNTASFIIQTSSFLKTDSVSKIDDSVLTNQIEFINRLIKKNQFQSKDFKDLINVYNEYWTNRESIIAKIPAKMSTQTFKLDMEKICEKLLSFVNIKIGEEVEPQVLINYIRSFNEFLVDLMDIKFEWFVKNISNLNMNDKEMFELVDNKLSTENRSYRVINHEKLIKTLEGKNIPEHYLIQVLLSLLSDINNCLVKKEWVNAGSLDQAMRLKVASAVVSAIRNSFLYLKEQPDYVSFQVFKKESIHPFTRVIIDSNSYEDFERRIAIIKDSFWYLRKQDEIGIEEALQLYAKENDIVEKEILKSCYYIYLDKFNTYINETINKNYEDKIVFIVKEVEKEFESIKFSDWEPKFKRERVSYLLAGLAAVWSTQQSKDVASMGKSLKPHCIQILCIFRLLGVDSETKGVSKHLAQVLTGQGKSLVLSLLSSLLALMGHKIQVVCYSKYLASRDQKDFNFFYKEFQKGNQITYGTFDDMANKTIAPKLNGINQGLRELVDDCILNHNKKKKGQVNEDDVSNTLLLIDEVDVFFSDEFYGNTYRPCTRVKIPALANIQQHIWSMAKNGFDKCAIIQKVEDFVDSKVREGDQEFCDFNAFQFNSGEFTLLKESSNFIEEHYTNKSLYEEHLEQMVQTAKTVSKGNEKDVFINKFKICDGKICCRDDHSQKYESTVVHHYFNSFNYFRLMEKENKEIIFKANNDFNCGYLLIKCGSISYAKLPKIYPLILGVTGTLTTLNDYEKGLVKEYNIEKNSIMPSFFGHSNLKFNASADFICQDSEDRWLEKIFNHSNSKINLGQAVLIFFNTESELDKFHTTFFSKFYRLNIFSQNTEDHIKELYIYESGISKTVTLATKEMGRGVDYKSSVAVEKQGGVHVIQTFFSLDIKEEVQIKGRTARKDNKGSYELILCEEHLMTAGFLKEKGTTVNYESLNEKRKEKLESMCAGKAKRIETSQQNHETTMNFLKSFFEK